MLRQLPALAILAAEEFVRRSRIGHAQPGRIPNQLLAGAIGHVLKVVRLRLPAGLLEVAGGRCRGYTSSMMLELKLRKVGNSVGLVLSKEALAHLNVEEGDTVSVTEGPEGSLRMSPHRAEVARQMEAVQDVMKRYRHALRELAK